MEIRLLGPVEVLSGGQPLRLGGPRQQALLAYLVLRNGDVVQAPRLLEELWYDPPAGGVGAVHTNVSRLRRVVGDRLATVGTGYAFRLEESDRLDLAQFRELLAEAGSADDPSERARLLRAADALWHGTPFDGLDVPFVATEALALEELRLAAVEERIEAELDAGRDGDLVAELAALVARYPLRERLREHWIVALYRSGRQAEALEAHRETRRMFDDELGLELSPALAALERAILQHDPSLDRKAAPKPAPVSQQPRRRSLLGVVALAAALAAVGAATALLLTRHHPARTVAEPPSTTTTIRTIAAAQVARHRVRHARAKPKRRPAALVDASPAPATTTVVETTAPVTTHPKVTRKHTTVAPLTTTHHAVTTTRPATTTHAVTTTPRPPVKTTGQLSTISDSFDGTVISAQTWSQIGEGTGWTMSQHDGHLEFSFEPGTTPDPRDGVYGGHVWTQCTFPGDFDARVDYALVQWPGSNGMGVSLVAFLGPKPTGWSASRTAMGADQYMGYVAGKWTQASTHDLSGALRIARVNGVVTAYYLRGPNWVPIGSSTNDGAASIGLQVLGGQTRSVPFNGQPVIVDFDNFRLTAAGDHCP